MVESRGIEPPRLNDVNRVAADRDDLRHCAFRAIVGGRWRNRTSARCAPVFEAGVATKATAPSETKAATRFARRLPDVRSLPTELSDSNRDQRETRCSPTCIRLVETGGVEPRHLRATRVPDGLGDHHRRSFQRRAEELNLYARWRTTGFKPAAIPRSHRPSEETLQERHGRNGGIRTRDLLVPNQARF